MWWKTSRIKQQRLQTRLKMKVKTRFISCLCQLSLFLIWGIAIRDAFRLHHKWSSLMHSSVIWLICPSSAHFLYKAVMHWLVIQSFFVVLQPRKPLPTLYLRRKRTTKIHSHFTCFLSYRMTLAWINVAFICSYFWKLEVGWLLLLSLYCGSHIRWHQTAPELTIPSCLCRQGIYHVREIEWRSPCNASVSVNILIFPVDMSLASINRSSNSFLHLMVI